MTLWLTTTTRWRLLVTSLLLFFLALANRHALAGDLAAHNHASLAVRICLILAASLVIGLRAGPYFAMEKTRRWTDLVLIFCFCGLVYLPLATHASAVTKSFVRVGEYLEKVRRQQQGSILSIVRAFPGTYEKYWQDNSILPKALIHLNAMVKIYLFGVSPNPTVALGEEGFYFEGYGARKVEKGIVESFDNIADYMGMIPFSQLELWKWKQTLEERAFWLRKRGVDYVFVLAPTKGLVYPEYLPASLRKRIGGKRRYMQLSDFLRTQANIHFIDLLPPLLAAKKRAAYPLLFYKTDFHWNFYGAFIAYQAIIREMRRFFPQYPLTPLSLDDFDIDVNPHWAHHRFMNMIGLPERLHRHEHYLTLVPRPGTPLYGLKDLPPEGIHDVYPPKSRLTNERGEFMKIRMVHNKKAPLESILLLGDSFMEKCVYYFSANVREVWNYRTVVNFPYRIFLYKNPQIAIQEILNMFLLRPPPENPAAIRQEFLQARFLDLTRQKARRVLLSSRVVQGEKAVRIPIPKTLQKRPECLVRVRMASNAENNRVTVFLETGSGRMVQWSDERVERENVFYVSVPPGGGVKALVLRSSAKSETGPEVSDAVCIMEPTGATRE